MKTRIATLFALFVLVALSPSPASALQFHTVTLKYPITLVPQPFSAMNVKVVSFSRSTYGGHATLEYSSGHRVSVAFPTAGTLLSFQAPSGMQSWHQTGMLDLLEVAYNNQNSYKVSVEKIYPWSFFGRVYNIAYGDTVVTLRANVAPTSPALKGSLNWATVYDKPNSNYFGTVNIYRGINSMGAPIHRDHHLLRRSTSIGVVVEDVWGNDVQEERTLRPISEDTFLAIMGELKTGTIGVIFDNTAQPWPIGQSAPSKDRIVYFYSTFGPPRN